MTKNYYDHKNTTPTAYPDIIEPNWKQGTAPPPIIRAQSYTDPVKEALGFVIKYSLWFVLSVVISVGLALRWDLDVATGLVIWGLVATAGYIAIFGLLSVFTPEGVSIVNQVVYYWTDYLKHKIDSNNNLLLEQRRMEIRRELLLTSKTEQQQPLLQKTESPTLEAFAWRPDADFQQDVISDELFRKEPKKDNTAVSVLSDFLIDLYDHPDELLRDNEIINMQAGITLPWSKRSEIPAEAKAAMQAILGSIEPPLIEILSNGRVIKLNTRQYPTKQDAIAALSI